MIEFNLTSFGTEKQDCVINTRDTYKISCFFIELSNAFAFPYTELPVINILYGLSGIYGHFLLWSSLFSFVILSRLIIFVCYKNDVLMI